MWDDKCPEGSAAGSLQMEGLSPSLRLELMRGWSGFTLTGKEADEGLDELVRSLRLVSPKDYGSIKDYIAQNPLYDLTLANRNSLSISFSAFGG
jgi:hypothetical protein